MTADQWIVSKEEFLKSACYLPNSEYDEETLKRYRQEAVKLMLTLGHRLGIQHTSIATGCLFYHRFYLKRAYQEFPRWYIAPACLFLSGKVEETPKKIKDVVEATKQITVEFDRSDVAASLTEELILAHEKLLIETINFDLNVVHPYTYLLKIAKTLKGSKPEINELVQTAWSLINDSLATPISLLYSPQLIAISMLYSAFNLLKDRSDGQKQASNSTLSTESNTTTSSTAPKNGFTLSIPPESWWLSCITAELVNKTQSNSTLLLDEKSITMDLIEDVIRTANSYLSK